MNPGDKKYKLNHIKAYGSTERLYGSQFNYQTVFEESQTTYLYCEFSFYNKLFDEEDWTANVTFKGFQAYHDGTRRELCTLNETISVTRDLNVINSRQGWGMDVPGGFWKRGDYDWEVSIDNEFVTKLRLHVESGGAVTKEENPYFDIESVRFYSGAYDGIPVEERRYMTQFKGSETPYLFIELNLINKQSQSWFGEMFFNIYTESGQLKCQLSENKLINKEPNISYTSGWGRQDPGIWFTGQYRLEVIFMNVLVAVVPFQVGDSWIEGTSPLLTQANATILPSANQPQKVELTDLSIEALLLELNAMIGLGEIKQKVKDFADYVKFMQYRAEQGLEKESKINVHTIFTGNPGTGKTTVANLMGKIFKALGLLSTGHVLEVGRADLVAEFIGQTAPKVKAVIEKARGGVLFIDEAYGLARSKEDGKDFGQEVIEVLIKEMSDGKGDIAVFVAGYPEPMSTFLDSNPGLRSRFNLHYHFADYLPQELLQILDYKAIQKNVQLTAEARELIHRNIIEAYRNRDSSFGNARLIAGWVDEAKMNLGLRLMRSGQDLKILSSEQLKTIEVADAKAIFKSSVSSLPDIGINEILLQQALNELNTLVGLTIAKAEILELVKLVRYYKESGKDVLGKFSLHTVFLGNPGTGKTTVARIYAQILKSLGILERGLLIETDRQGLVASYIGQTAPKTQQLIAKSVGSVLFIDEAYALSQRGENDFGQEAVETLLKQMEDRRGQFVIVVAGYTDKMKDFLEMNPGLSSRFDREILFEDYSPEDLFLIALSMLSQDSIVPNAEAAAYLRQYLRYLYDTKDKFFGNARAVRKIVSEAINNQNLRLAEIPKHERTNQMLQTLTLADVEEFKIGTSSGNSGIGFRIGNRPTG